MWKKFILIIFKTQTLYSLCCECSGWPVVVQKCVEGGGRRGGLNSGTQFITPEKQGKAVMILTHTRCVALWAAYLQIPDPWGSESLLWNRWHGSSCLKVLFSHRWSETKQNDGENLDQGTTSTLVCTCFFFITMRSSLVLLLSLD